MQSIPGSKEITMADVAIPRQDTMGGALDVLKLIQGVRGTSTTTSANISQEGMNALVQQILSSSQGLAAVASGARGAGMYNSTTQQQLMNDLVTQSSAKLAAAKAGTTTKTAGALRGSDLGTLLASFAATKLLGPTIKTASGKLGLDKLGQNLSDAIFGGSSAGTAGSLIGPGSDAAYSAMDAGYSALGAETAGAGNLLGGSEGTALAAEAGAGSAVAGSLTGEGALDAYAAMDAGYAAAGSSALAAGSAAAEGATAATAAEGAGFWETALSWAADFFSDERLKTDIKPVGKLDNGLPIYSYHYIGDPKKTHIGVIAQEAQKLKPEAVAQHQSGFLTVNYDKLLGAD
jgi:hypothetical protein